MGSLDGVSKISLTLAQEDIPSEFKLEWMNKTLKFIKNDNELMLKYPEMPSNEIKFLKAMIGGVSCDVGISFKSLYAPLWEALRIIGLQYEFRMSVQRTKSSYGHLFLEKIPRRQDGVEIGSSELESSVSSNSIPDVTKKSKKQNTEADKKYVETVKKIIDSISPLFLKNTLQAIYEFLSDETQASCVFDSLARVEAQFIQQFHGIFKRRTLLEELFSPLCNKFWVKIGDVLDNNTLFKLEISSVTVDKETAKRYLTVQKVPIFGDKTSKPKSPKKRSKKEIKDVGNENLVPNVVNVKETHDVSSLLLRSIENCHNKIEAKTKKNEPIHQLSIEPTNQCQSTNLKRPITKEIREVTIKTPPTLVVEVPRIDNGSSMEFIDKTVGKKVKPLAKPLPTMSSTPLSIPQKVINTAGLCKRKVKLIEALSTPMESDIGLRMMRSMGWEGGSLGAREGGITEPIMPALHLVPKAGLGHEKVEKKKPENNKTRSENRIRILESVLELLKKNLILSYVDFEICLNKSEINFLNNVKVQLNRRKLLGVNVKAEIDLVQNILTFLIKNPSVRFDVEVLSRMRIKFEKIAVLPKQNHAESLKKLTGSNQQSPTNKSLIQKRLQVNEPNNQSVQSLISTSNSQANQLSNSQTNQLSNGQTNQQSCSQTNQQSCGQTNQESSSQTNQPSCGPTKQQSSSQTNQPSCSQTNQPSCGQTKQQSSSQTNQPSCSQTNQPSCGQTKQQSSSQTNQPSCSQTNQQSNSQTNQSSSSPPNQSSISEENQQSKSLNTLFQTLSNKTNEDMNNNEEDDCFLTNKQILSLLDLKEQLKISKNMLRKLKLRLFVMKSCLDFLKSGEDSVMLNYGFRVKMCKSVQNFLYKLCSFVNNRKADRFAYSVENYVWLEIKQCVGENYVIAEIDASGRHFGFSKISVPNNKTLCDVNQNDIVNKETNSPTTGAEDSESIEYLLIESVEISHFGGINSTFVQDCSGDNSSVGIDKNINANSDTSLENKTENKEFEVKSDTVVADCNKNAEISCTNSTENIAVVKNCTGIKNDKSSVQTSNNIFHFGSINANIDIFNKSESKSDDDKGSFKFSFGAGNTKAKESVASDENKSIPFTNVRIIQSVGKIMTVETAANVQSRISAAITPNFLPSLKCHGIKSDSLIYTCYNEKSLVFLKEVLNDFQIVKYEISGSYKMSVVVGSFEGTLKNVFACLKMYHEFNFEKWEVIQVTHYDDKIEFSMSMDSESFDYISRNNFRLLAGVDEITFNIIV